MIFFCYGVWFFLLTTKYITNFPPVIYCNDRWKTWPDRGRIFVGTGTHGTVHMSRGRPPYNGMELALPVAEARGRVMEIVQNGNAPAMFVIDADGKIFFVFIRRVDPFRITPREMEAQNRTVLVLIRSLPASADIIREFWAYSKYGTVRFFRVEDSLLLEIGRDGRPLAVAEGKPGSGPASSG